MCAALANNQSSVPSTHVKWFTTPSIPCKRGPNILFKTLQTPALKCTSPYTYAYTCTHTFEKLNLENNCQYFKIQTFNFPIESYNRKNGLKAFLQRHFFFLEPTRPLHLLLWFLAGHLRRHMPSVCVSLIFQLWQYSVLPGRLLMQLVWEVHLQVWILFRKISTVSYVI